MAKHKGPQELNTVPAETIPPDLQPPSSTPEIVTTEPLEEKKKRRGGCFLLAIVVLAGVLVLVGVIFFREKIADYFPTEWVKKEISVNSGLPQRDKDAINTIYQDLGTRLDHDKPSALKDPGTINNYEYVTNMPKNLRKYKRLSLLKLLRAMKEDLQKSGKFVRRDYFLPYFPDAEVLQWEVQYNKSSNAATPAYYLVARIRNSTGVAISKVLVEINSSGFNYTQTDTLAVQTPFRKLFILMPAERFPNAQYEAFNCPISGEEFDMLNGNSGAATLVKAFLEEK